MIDGAEGSTFIRHLPCNRCGSRDNNGLYSDGHTFCFGCGEHTQGEGQATLTKGAGRVPLDLIVDGEVSALPIRNISQETCQHFGYVKARHQGKPCQVAPYYDEEGKLVAQKIRFPDKTFKVLGSLETALPFGAHAFPKTGRMIVVTEGEIDALSMSQVQRNKYPVVSIASGAGPQVRKYIAKQRDYFLGFEKVILMFDNDEKGREAAQTAATIIGRRAHIAELPLKDANDMLVAGRVDELLTAMWKAKQYRPEGIVDMSTLKDKVKERPTRGLSWWSPKLTDLTFGKRTGELYAFGAGTGVGKTDFFTQDMMHMVTVHGVPVGVFSLEQAVAETATRIAGKLAGKTFHIPDSGWTDVDLDGAWDTLEKSGKVFLYDSFGANEWDTVKEKIEYLAHAEGVKWFYLDHLTALAAAEDDERTALERIMSEMGSMVKKLDIAIHFISHLATPEGKPHEEGGRVMIRHFKGSRAIGFWSHFMFGLERDQQAENEAVKLTTTFRVLKDRYTGRATGEVFWLGYDRDTGLLYEADDPERQENPFPTEEAPGNTAEGPSDF